MPQGPLFLARAVYRRRRLRDAARLLPVFGLLLLLLPAFGEQSGNLAHTAIYLFAVWALLILAACLLAPALSRSEAEGDPETDQGPQDMGDS
ncbi:hypothetical protein [Tabrizicola oligotrophica]|uniref:Uncharacterized protein n=1 Tax=Tabrizicola oligotrophica TaxID=2710650 RepID=A0A6M0QNS7_9RHOB|nr:hypothetical protein [Tabrizicola oligotrophica]NEY89085.1 hypothetical protein [Tabrizicola oligotrophica]